MDKNIKQFIADISCNCGRGLKEPHVHALSSEIQSATEELVGKVRMKTEEACKKMISENSYRQGRKEGYEAAKDEIVITGDNGEAVRIIREEARAGERARLAKVLEGMKGGDCGGGTESLTSFGRGYYEAIDEAIKAIKELSNETK